MHINPNIFREYDIRGIAETQLTPPVVYKIGQAYGSFVLGKGVTKVLIGGDVRLSTPVIREELIKGLTSVGLHIIDIGTVTSPMFYFGLHHLDLDGGIMITGSHNPGDYNGMKMAYGKSTIYGADIQQIKKIIEADKITESEGKGTVAAADISEAYLNMLYSKIRLGPRRLKVVADAGNGAASLYIEKFLESLGCEVIPLFCEPDGSFPNHHPDPVKRENLTYLVDEIKKHQAEVGVAYDGDADRLGVVDDTGEVIWGDKLMALYWREILATNPGQQAIIEVKCSQALVDEIERLGGRPYFYKTGHSLIKAKMKELDALFTGEMSGHMFFADEYYGFDDAFYATGRLLRTLSHSEKNLSGLLSDLPQYYSTAETRIDCPDEVKFSIIEKIKDQVLMEYDAITVDGVRVIYPDGWGLVRASNTQPVLVARCEAKTPESLSFITGDLKERILRAGLQDFKWEY
ncbi:phosphomannomutase/phosphoglucomutase [Phosphitispora sp. TUW77]|uniref:phosphomannomutase/phosphoglucomutase n=1 Tax=Phosphitispora sp. TUW77 TaxID=3152361 RepID=UPI003AB8A20D